MKTHRSLRISAAAGLIAGLLAACTSGPAAPAATPSPVMVPSDSATRSASQAIQPQPQPSASAVATAETMTIQVFFLMHDPRAIEFLVPAQRSIPKAKDRAAAAIRELLAGLTEDEQSGMYPDRRGQLARLSTAVPGSTLLRGIEILNGIATVDLSGDFGSGNPRDLVFRQAQVVYTLTQFPSVDRVEFRLEGEPMAAIEGHEGTASFGAATRDFYYDQRRSVFVDAPAWGSSVGDAVRVTGATYHDVAFRVALVDGATDGILAEQIVRASCDPCVAPDAWGPFETLLLMPAGSRPADLRLRIWEPPFNEAGPTTVFDYPLG